MAPSHRIASHASRRGDPGHPTGRDHLAVRLALRPPLGGARVDERGSLLRPALRQRRALVPPALPFEAGARACRWKPPRTCCSIPGPRAGRRRPSSHARFVVLFRDPVQRAISQYWHSRRLHAEDQPLEVALALEETRLAGQEEIVVAGGESFAHRNFSYKARGHYAEQLRRWFAVIERERFLVMESEELFDDPSGPARALEWLGLSPRHAPFPATNDAPRARPEEQSVVEALRRHFAPFNEDLFELLGRRLWEG